MKGKITDNFSWEEFERSAKADELGIDNSIPDSEVIKTPIRALVVNLLQPLRNAVGEPLTVNSGYRSKLLNQALKGSKNSQHMKGEAADIDADDPLLLAQHVLRKNLPFDQMILYSTFVHLSYKCGGPQRRQILYDKSYKDEYPNNEKL